MALAAMLAQGFAAGAALAQTAGPSLVVDAATGAVLHEESASTAWHPASTTKMMTAYVALRAARAGRIGMETPIPASKLASSQPRVKVYIKPGQEITLENALKVMMVKSANDIAYVIAEGVAGDVPGFVAMMNAEARRLGLSDTVFRNPNGWHHPEQQTSARDLAVLAMTMLREFPEHADLWGIGAVQLGRQTLLNTNGLIGRYSGANGFKTGFVCASGFNVVATATRGGRTLIAIVLGAYSGAERTVKAAQILDAAFSSWGGNGRNVLSMGPSGTAARNICSEVRAFGRGAPLADDADAAGPISFAPAGGNSDSAGMYDVFRQPVAQSSMGRTATGRLTLGPRATFTPIQIAYGRTAGSDRAPIAANVARRPETQVAGRGAGEQGAQTTGGQASVPGQAFVPGLAVAAGAAAAATRSPAGAAGTAPRPGAVERARAAAQAGQAAGQIVPPGRVLPGVPASAAAFAPASGAAAEPLPNAAGQGAPGPIRLHGAIGAAPPAPPRPSAAAGIRPSANGAARPAATQPAGRAPAALPAARPVARPMARPVANAPARPPAATPAPPRRAAAPAAARPPAPAP
jgi:D-alanyl-D-alanine carboxypeptidase